MQSWSSTFSWHWWLTVVKAMESMSAYAEISVPQPQTSSFQLQGGLFALKGNAGHTLFKYTPPITIVVNEENTYMNCSIWRNIKVHLVQRQDALYAKNRPLMPLHHLPENLNGTKCTRKYVSLQCNATVLSYFKSPFKKINWYTVSFWNALKTYLFQPSR